MIVFLSHAHYDAPTAHFLKSALGPQLGVRFFLLPDDAPPGTAWIEQIRIGVERSDELYSVVTPQSLRRPWMSAEWACFWLQGKPMTPLLIDVASDQLWEPMQAFQSVNLVDVTSVAALLRSIVGKTTVEPAEGIRPLADEIVREIPRIRARQAADDVAGAARLLRENLRAGSGNINPRDVQALVTHDQIVELLDMATSPAAASVKQRQVAVALIDLGRIHEAARIADVIQNRAEVRTVCTRIVERIAPGATNSSAEWETLDRLYSRLAGPQRRDVLEVMERRGVVPRGQWAAAGLP
jgi:TIR domain